MASSRRFGIGPGVTDKGSKVNPWKITDGDTSVADTLTKPVKKPSAPQASNVIQWLFGPKQQG
jgi:hypothetical protein